MVEPPSDEDLAGFRDRGKMVIVRLAEQASFGDVLVTGLHREGDNLSYIGRIVQIREKQGAFFSDLVLIRHPDEKIRAHANQCFWILCPEDAARVLERGSVAFAGDQGSSDDVLHAGDERLLPCSIVRIWIKNRAITRGPGRGVTTP